MLSTPHTSPPWWPPESPAALHQEDGAMFTEAATRVGITYALSLVAFTVLMHVLA